MPSIRAWAVDLQEHTRLAFDRYAEEATENFLKRVRADAGTSVDGAQSSRARRLRDGAIVARAGGQDGIIGVSDGLVHHWFAASFIDGVTLADALNVSFAYADYHAFYRPILASRLLAHDGNTYRALLRLRESAGGMTAILDVTTRVEYFHPDPRTAYTISTSEDIREVKDAGSPREQHLPAGRDSGYLWRAVTLSRLIERDAGVLIEMETLGLSRSFPPFLGWIIEPIARRIGRKSVELSLQEFRTAVRARTQR
ncbi:MAG TPA: hypothetical protein VIK60_10270 [Vicinamibacterales bacterium]